MINLYADQESSLKEILRKFRQRFKAALLVAPCGYGKTIVFSAIAKRAKDKGNRVLICVHRQELLRQTCLTLKKFDVSYGIIASGYEMKPHEKVQVASIQTLCRRIKIPIQRRGGNKVDGVVLPPTLLIIDEAHHAIAPTFQKVISHFDCKVLGVTATPWRSNGEGLNKIFDCMIIGGTADELINQGRLCRPIYYAPPQQVDLEGVKISMGDFDKVEISKRVNKPTVTGDAIEHYKRICPEKRAVVFCVSRKHADDVAVQFNLAGVPAASIDGSLSDRDRFQRIKDLKNGYIKVLTSCELISEGFDLPTIEAAIMLRPTKSLAIYIQQAGRALRTAEGKQNAIILDHVGNCFRFGAIEQINDWSLEGLSKKTKEKENLPIVRRCKMCFAILSMSAKRCHLCNSEPEISERELKYIEGQLQAIEKEKLKIDQQKERKSAWTLDALIALGIKRGMKNPHGWAWHVMNGRKRA